MPRRRATGRFKLPDAGAALNTLMLEGDVYKIGRQHYLVVPLRADMLDMLILAAAATEDDEEGDHDGGDINSEPHDEETDLGIDDLPHDEPWQDLEPSLAGIHAGMQEGISMGDREGPDDDAEPDSEAEEDDHGGCNPHISEADIDAQRGRIASKWPTFSRGGRP
jgi:hypothetical protein